jgi:hypothetical protein
MQLRLSILQSTKQGQWGFLFLNGSLNGASPVQVRRSPATVSENGVQVRHLSTVPVSHKPENPPLTRIPRTFARKGQDYDGISIDNPLSSFQDEGFFHFSAII